MLEAIGFFALLEVVGLAAAPLAALAFGRLPGAGLGFAKPLGLLLVTWAVWILGSFGAVHYGVGEIAGVFAALMVAGAAAALRQRSLATRLRDRGGAEGRFGRWRATRLAARALPVRDPARRSLWIGAEAVFAVGFAAMALLVAYSPDVWGTEKPMDMAFVNAINASDTFPPHDPWLAGADLNYYYLGHFAMALPVRVLGLAPDHGYNLAVAALFGLTAAAVFTLAGTIWAAAKATRPDLRGGPVAAGVAPVVVCLGLGNPPGGKAWLGAANPPAGVGRVGPAP